MSKDYVSIIDIKGHIGKEVTISVWVVNKSGKGKTAFLQPRDETAFFQVVTLKPNSIEKFGEEEGTGKFNIIKHLNQEASILIMGIVKEDSRSEFGYELDVVGLEIIGRSEDYPVTLKEHGTDLLMGYRHLWLCLRKQMVIVQVRNAVIYTSYKFFDKNGFIKFNSPILSGNAAEDPAELFETGYFGTPVYLSRPGQLYLEAGTVALGHAFDSDPVFRAEGSKTHRHLAELWMMDIEYSFFPCEESPGLQEAHIKALIQGVFDRVPQVLKILECDIDLLKRYITGPFKRVSYDDVILLPQEHENDEDTDYEHPEYGDDFGSPHETQISDYFGVPTFVINYPASFKAFYMKSAPGDPECVLYADLLAPEGCGEIIGGSACEDDYDAFVAKVDVPEIDKSEYELYLDLCRYGSVLHAGFGTNIEHMVTLVAGTKRIHETIPFPRMLHCTKP